MQNQKAHLLAKCDGIGARMIVAELHQHGFAVELLNDASESSDSV